MHIVKYQRIWNTEWMGKMDIHHREYIFCQEVFKGFVGVNVMNFLKMAARFKASFYAPRLTYRLQPVKLG